MKAAADYRELARECLQEAEQTRNEERKKTFLGIAKLYNQTALNLEGGEAPPADPGPDRGRAAFDGAKGMRGPLRGGRAYASTEAMEQQ